MTEKTKAQLARQLYGCALSDLSAGQKAAVTKAYDKQFEVAYEDEYEDEDELVEESATGIIEVKIGRPGVNGLKASLVREGAVVQDVFNQSGLSMKPEKEGFMIKSSNHYPAGKTLSKNDPVFDGDVIAIVPGVDSSN